MGGDMHNGTVSSLLSQECGSCILVEYARRAQLFRNRLGLLHSKSQATSVRKSHHKRSFQRYPVLLGSLSALMTNFHERGGRQIGHVQALNNKLHTIKKTMER